MKLFPAALAACCVSLIAPSLRAQLPSSTPPPLLSDGSPTASIQFADGRTLPLRSRGGQFPLVIGYAGQAVNVQCRIPAALASRLVFQSLDGGTLSSSPPGADGTTTLQFQTGSEPGLYRVAVILSGYSAVLQFWVPTPDGNNPPLLTP